jgi:hypothetical protein
MTGSVRTDVPRADRQRIDMRRMKAHHEQGAIIRAALEMGLPNLLYRDLACRALGEYRRTGNMIPAMRLIRVEGPRMQAEAKGTER